jgi:hypothetical protein
MRENPTNAVVLSGHVTGPLVRWQSLAVGFSDGFVGGVLGGASYRLLFSQFPVLGGECTWGRIALVALLLGLFECWRTTRQRKQADVKWHMAWLLVASASLFWSLDAFSDAPAPTVVQPPRRLELKQEFHRELVQRCTNRQARHSFQREEEWS